jgi:hypothetical protein
LFVPRIKLELNIVEALENDHHVWRTVDGIVKDTGLPRITAENGVQWDDEIDTMVASYPDNKGLTRSRIILFGMFGGLSVNITRLLLASLAPKSIGSTLIWPIGFSSSDYFLRRHCRIGSPAAESPDTE